MLSIKGKMGCYDPDSVQAIYQAVISSGKAEFRKGLRLVSLY